MYNLEPVQAIISLLKRVAEDERVPESLKNEINRQLDDISNDAQNTSVDK